MSKYDRGPARVMWRPKVAWRRLIADPSEENRVAFVDALERCGR